MANFTSATPSYDAMLASIGANGLMSRHVGLQTAATTTSATNSGGATVSRGLYPIIIPTVGSGVQGYTLNSADVIGGTAGTVIYTALEYALGTLTLNGNSASALGSMPTKTQLGTSIQTASKYLICYVKTSGTATTPTITITYTNQDGTTSQSTSIVLPTSPLVNSGYLIPLANNDTGVRAITGLSSSVTTGTMVLTFYGLLELAISNIAVVSAANGSVETLLTPTIPKLLCATGEAVNFYRFGSNAIYSMFASLALAPETT